MQKCLFTTWHNIKATLLNDNLKWPPSTFPQSCELPSIAFKLKQASCATRAYRSRWRQLHLHGIMGGCVIIPAIPEWRRQADLFIIVEMVTVQDESAALSPGNTNFKKVSLKPAHMTKYQVKERSSNNHFCLAVGHEQAQRNNLISWTMTRWFKRRAYVLLFWNISKSPRSSSTLVGSLEHKANQIFKKKGKWKY